MCSSATSSRVWIFRRRASLPRAPQRNALHTSALTRLVAIPPAPALIEPEPALAEAAAAIDVRTVESEDGRIRVRPRSSSSTATRAIPRSACRRGCSPAPTDDGRGARRQRRGVDRSRRRARLADGRGADQLAGGRREGVPASSFLDVVRGDVPDARFRGKAVLIAGTASGSTIATSRSPRSPGVLIYAAFLDNVFRFDFVREPAWSWVFEWALFLALCAASAWAPAAVAHAGPARRGPLVACCSSAAPRSRSSRGWPSRLPRLFRDAGALRPGGAAAHGE